MQPVSAGLWPVCHPIMFLPVPICYFHVCTSNKCKHTEWLWEFYILLCTAFLILSLSLSLFLSWFVFPRLSKPFPIGDRVTFSGKNCVCQQCSHKLTKPNEPIKIHGPSRKSHVRLALSALFRATRRCSAPSLMRCARGAHLAHLA